MKIRNRLTLWYAGILVGSLVLMGGILHYELVGEYESGHVPESPTEKIQDIMLFYALPTASVLIVGGTWLIRRALRPIEILTTSAERVHAGNLGERIPRTGRGDELDRLADVFNTMLARLEAGVESIRAFTLNSSHELKTPLTILSAETELALNDRATPSHDRPRLASQLEEIQRLSKLVDSLSLLAKGDAGLPIIAQVSFDLEKILLVAVEDVRTLAVPRRIAIEVGRCDAARFTGDSARLRQAMLNLLENAVKHNQPGGWVRVDLRVEADEAELTIANGGVEIPAEFIPRVFDRFSRGPGVVDGSGLGLSITKTIVEAHGGTIACRSENGVVQFIMRMTTRPPSNVAATAPAK